MSRQVLTTEADANRDTHVAPYSEEAEESLIGAMLISPQAVQEATQLCTADDFYIVTHQRIFDAVRRVTSRGDPLDTVLVLEELRREVGAAIEMADLIHLQINTPSVTSAKWYAQVVREDSRRRRRQLLAHELDVACRTRDDSAYRSAFGGLVELDADQAIFDGTEGGLVPIDWATFWTHTPPNESWTVERIVPKGRQVAVYSPAKTGKSLIGLEMAAALATGTCVLGYPPSDPISVVYLDLEMTTDDLYERLSDLGYGPDTDLGHLHYYLLPSLPPLDTAEGGLVLASIAARHDAQLVVVDTMARAVAGFENSSDTYRDFFRHTGLPLKRAGRALLRFDHQGQDAANGQRGSTAKNDDVDVVWRLTRREDGLLLKRTHSRLSWVPAEVHLVRTEGFPLRHTVYSGPVARKVIDLAAELDHLGVPVDAAINVANEALRGARGGRRREDVAAALRHRRTSEPR